MIRDLVGRHDNAVLEADVHVIGAGTAGLLLATRLAKAGKKIIVTESGGEHQHEDTHPLNEVVHLRSTYAGAAHGRFRCLGGTSTRWGGAMIPFQAADMAQTGESAWPLSHGELTAYQAEVEALFHLVTGPYDQPKIVTRTDYMPPSHIARLAKWPSFPRRNVAKILAGDIRNINGPEIWLNATATKFNVAPDGRLAFVSACGPDGAQMRVHSSQTVIAAGAIESTRLLLLADRQHDNRIFAPDGILGRYFHDHLSVKVGGIQPVNRLALNRLAGFRFEGSGLRNLRFEPSEAPAIRATIPAGFAHIAFAIEEGSGFDALRALYRQFQKRRPPNVASLLRLAKATPWFAKAVWWRYHEYRLLYPPEAEIELHMVIEQIPRADNRVTLSTDRTDRYEQPLAAIDWAVSREDEGNLTRSTDMFVDLWQHSTLARLGTIVRRPPGEAETALAEGGGVYHPCGSTRMGRTAAEGVVDRDLRTFRVPNLSIVSTSNFPSAGGANPTMMLLMAALRAADRILKTLRTA
jgi:choline dehydrogenase-like flavoprotein